MRNEKLDKLIRLQKGSIWHPIRWQWKWRTSEQIDRHNSYSNRHSTNIVARRFSHCAPTVWNSLHSFVCTADSFTCFRSQLRTDMFARHLYCSRFAVCAFDIRLYYHFRAL